MPHFRIGVAHSLVHEKIDMLATTDRLVLMNGTKRRRWSNAVIIAPEDGAVAVHREGGVAVVVSRAGARATNKALRDVPDPVVLLVAAKAPRGWEDASHALIVPVEGELRWANAINTLDGQSVDTEVLAAARTAEQAAPAPGPTSAPTAAVSVPSVEDPGQGHIAEALAATLGMPEVVGDYTIRRASEPPGE